MNSDRYIPVEGQPNLLKDTKTNAIINNDRRGYLAAKQRTREALEQKKKLEEHDQKLNNMESLLTQILAELKKK